MYLYMCQHFRKAGFILLKNSDSAAWEKNVNGSRKYFKYIKKKLKNKDIFVCDTSNYLYVHLYIYTKICTKMKQVRNCQQEKQTKIWKL